MSLDVYSFCGASPPFWKNRKFIYKMNISPRIVNILCIYLIAAAAILVWSIAWAEAWLSWTAIGISIGAILAILLIATFSTVVLVARFALTEVSLEEASASAHRIAASRCTVIAGCFATLARLFTFLSLWSLSPVVTTTKTITTWSESSLLYVQDKIKSILRFSLHFILCNHF